MNHSVVASPWELLLLETEVCNVTGGGRQSEKLRAEEEYLLITLSFWKMWNLEEKERARVGWIWEENRWAVVVPARGMGRKKWKTLPALLPLETENVYAGAPRGLGQMGCLEKNVCQCLPQKTRRQAHEPHFLGNHRLASALYLGQKSLSGKEASKSLQT